MVVTVYHGNSDHRLQHRGAKIQISFSCYLTSGKIALSFSFLSLFFKIIEDEMERSL